MLLKRQPDLLMLKAWHFNNCCTIVASKDFKVFQEIKHYSLTVDECLGLGGKLMCQFAELLLLISHISAHIPPPVENVLETHAF